MMVDGCIFRGCPDSMRGSPPRPRPRCRSLKKSRAPFRCVVRGCRRQRTSSIPTLHPLHEKQLHPPHDLHLRAARIPAHGVRFLRVRTPKHGNRKPHRLERPRERAVHTLRHAPAGRPARRESRGRAVRQQHHADHHRLRFCACAWLAVERAAHRALVSALAQRRARHRQRVGCRRRVVPRALGAHSSPAFGVSVHRAFFLRASACRRATAAACSRKARRPAAARVAKQWRAAFTATISRSARGV